MTIQAWWNINEGNEVSVTQNSEGALVFFTDPDILDPLGDHNMSSFVGAIPFTRQAAGETKVTFEKVDIAMALIESLKLDGTNTKTYTADTIYSKPYLISEEWDALTYDKGHFFMNVLQPSLTDTIREEIDPLEWTELLGNIGGTWEFLLILWGIFFVTIHNNGPQYKGRDLVQAVRQGVQNVVKGGTSIASTVGTWRDSGTSSLPESKEEVDVVLAWDSIAGITSERLKSINQDHPHPPPGYGFSETWATSTTPNRTGGDRHPQVASGARKPLRDGLNQAPSSNTPVVVDDLPRPGLRPL
ncbi:unnamed protein product [Ascophyllum nodosum]